MSIFEPGTFIVSIIGFIIIYYIIKRVAFKPLTAMMDQRRTYVESQITTAETSRAEAEALLAEQRALLEQARNEARNLLDTARARSDEQARQIIADAQAEAQRLLDEGRQLIERERTEALNKALQQVAEITVELTTKLLRNHVSGAVHEEMVAEAEKQLGELVC